MAFSPNKSPASSILILTSFIITKHYPDSIKLFKVCTYDKQMTSIHPLFKNKILFLAFVDLEFTYEVISR